MPMGRILQTGPSRIPPVVTAPPKTPQKKKFKRSTEAERLQLYSWDPRRQKHPPNLNKFNILTPDAPSPDNEEVQPDDEPDVSMHTEEPSLEAPLPMQFDDLPPAAEETPLPAAPPVDPTATSAPVKPEATHTETGHIDASPSRAGEGTSAGAVKKKKTLEARKTDKREKKEQLKPTKKIKKITEQRGIHGTILNAPAAAAAAAGGPVQVGMPGSTPASAAAPVTDFATGAGIQQPTRTAAPAPPIPAPPAATPVAPPRFSPPHRHEGLSPTVAEQNIDGGGGGGSGHSAGNTNPPASGFPSISLVSTPPGNFSSPITSIMRRLISPAVVAQMPSHYVGRYVAAITQLSVDQKLEQEVIVASFVEAGMIGDLVAFIKRTISSTRPANAGEN